MKIKCAILGATGLIGQQFIRMLANHPKFDITSIYASERSVNKRLDDIWRLPYFKVPEEFADLKVEDLKNISHNGDVQIAFSGLPTSIALDLENQLRMKGIAVFSNASAHRMDNDVPILIPEVNLDHLELVKHQQEKYKTDGFIVTNANCTVTGAAMYLAELMNFVEIDDTVITTYQAQSGAGYKGLSDSNIINNVLPHIQNEEEKVAIEANKIIGKVDDQGFIVTQNQNIIANCARVNVTDGHLESITTFVRNLEFGQDDLVQKFHSIDSPLNSDLYSAPKKHFVYLEDQDRPQPKIDSYFGEKNQHKGMSLIVGRSRIVGESISSYVLVHNTIRGGAGGSILNAELAHSKNYF